MVVGTFQGVGIADHTGLRVVASDGQGIAKTGSDRLADTGDHPRGDHVDATHVHIENAVRCLDREAAELCQGRWIAGRTVGQVGLVDRNFTACGRQAFERHRIIDGGYDGGRHLFNNIVVAATEPGRRNFQNAIEACGCKAHHRVDTPADLGEQDEAVPTATTASAAPRARRGCFSFLRGVGTCGNGFLQLLHVSELILTRCRFRCGDVGHAVGKQIRAQVQAAFAPQGQLRAVVHVNGNGPGQAGFQLFTGK
ncbi:hypothetical protein D3C85_1076100 [compost metagenome]